MQGGELYYHVRRYKRLSIELTKFYAAQIVIALDFLHKNETIYRDLKPENVLLGKDGYLKIADFGLSKQSVRKGEWTYTFCGTPEYISPEILLGLGHDKTVDWWSLGALVYEMLVGAPPHYSKSRKKMFQRITEVPIKVPKEWDDATKSFVKGLLQINVYSFFIK
jgi:serine/threonine protein kinase